MPRKHDLYIHEFMREDYIMSFYSYGHHDDGKFIEAIEKEYCNDGPYSSDGKQYSNRKIEHIEVTHVYGYFVPTPWHDTFGSMWCEVDSPRRGAIPTTVAMDVKFTYFNEA